ncbi:MAG: peptidase family M3 [Rhizobiales bacterium]|nr:M3 family metallopeptidase [Hyphomicrobiales bacterium]NRB14460.1 peptidase family M3 [Hyphomicrobiales bacterium]
MAYQQNWDNRDFYLGITDPKVELDIAQLKQKITTLSDEAKYFENIVKAAVYPDWNENIGAILGRVFNAHKMLSPIAGNLRTYAESAADLDGSSAEAQKYLDIAQQLESNLEQAFAPIMGFVARVDDKFAAQLFGQDYCHAYLFKMKQKRAFAQHLLPIAEEKLLQALSQNGLHAWYNMNQGFWRSLKVNVNGKTQNLAALYNMVSEPNRPTRQKAYEAIQTAWQSVKEPQAAVLNAITSWRIEENNRRSTVQNLHYLDVAARNNSISRLTLEAMMSAVYQRRDIGHRAIGAMQKHLAITKMMPWDLQARLLDVDAKRYEFAEAIDIIAACFAEFDPEMGAFAQMMATRGWIQAEMNENSAAGGYCDQFIAPRQPRIFMNYDGSPSNIMILAHELGHAWHYWVMRDIDPAEADYPHSLAETASLFAENLVKQHLLKTANDEQQVLRILWEDALNAAGYLNEMASRYEFEKQLNEQRIDGYMAADKLCDIMQNCAVKWFGDSLGGYDEYKWTTVGHFSIADTSFYNFPYIFGYLISLILSEQARQNPTKFVIDYKLLLQDTGRMSAEDLVQKYLHENIEDQSFWHKALDLAETSIAHFENLAVK